MKFQKTPIALAALALASAAHAAPDQRLRSGRRAAARRSPATFNQSAKCEVTGTNIRRVVFSIISSSGSHRRSTPRPARRGTATSTRASSPTATYTLRAMAYDAADTSTTAPRVTIRNSTTATRAADHQQPAPVVTFTRPRKRRSPDRRGVLRGQRDRRRRHRASSSGTSTASSINTETHLARTTPATSATHRRRARASRRSRPTRRARSARRRSPSPPAAATTQPTAGRRS